ncbi:hypothetical protein ACI3QN_10340, partial [Propionibacterium freudenreichii]
RETSTSICGPTRPADLHPHLRRPDKRVGFLMVALVLTGNGVDISHISDDDWFELIIQAAAGHLEVAEGASRIRGLVEAEGRPRA